ncbi:hypothetical protein JOB18_046110 [Solea senegalensis]|uniref:Uncharacterized protein n=1 Tax=Solea senegalensis TaxID=28829 RepID=A0AAV6TC11_SOLSE|nr:hypothetical protein JOB18_046110 [Solea senegalensis]
MAEQNKGLKCRTQNTNQSVTEFNSRQRFGTREINKRSGRGTKTSGKKARSKKAGKVRYTGDQQEIRQRYKNVRQKGKVKKGRQGSKTREGKTMAVKKSAGT